MKTNRKILCSILVVILFLLLVICIGPIDLLKHGYESERAEDLEEAFRSEAYVFNEGELEILISPMERHLEAVEIFLQDLPYVQGEICIELIDCNGNVKKSVKYSYDDLETNIWNKMYISSRLCTDETYIIRLYDEGGAISSSFLITFGYGESTLTLPGKILVIAVALLIVLFLLSVLWMQEEAFKHMRTYVIMPLALVILLSWSYYSNPFDVGNTKFEGFQSDSDALVFGRVCAKLNHIEFTDEYGLGWYSDIKGKYTNYNSENNYITDLDKNIDNGYLMGENGIVVDSNEYTTEYFIRGNYIMFASGIKHYITYVFDNGEGLLYVYLISDYELTEDVCGSLDDIVVLDADGNMQPIGVYSSYKSQYGLQGKVMGKLAMIMGKDNSLLLLPLICAVLLAVTVVIFAYLLYRKYNMLFSMCFLVTFWLSPWVVNFANSVYWVEFTWLLPTVFGMALSIWSDRRWIRYACYIGIFASIVVKSLCGYEYMTFVMLCAIFPLVIDLLLCAVNKDGKNAKRYFVTIFWGGILALAGFFVALIVHAYLRGDSDILCGIRSIWKEDVLRRTFAEDADNFDAVYAESINASILEVLSKYFKFSTQVITGVEGNLFPLISVAPMFIFAWNKIKSNVVYWQDIFMYVFSFLSSISWFVLAKQHSYIHTHMNYVAWYYFFVPICFYIIIKQIIKKSRNNEEK